MLAIDRTVYDSFERGVVILSIDTEQIWGYLKCFDEKQFEIRYPNSLKAHERLLALLQEASISATWFVVGGMALRGSLGPDDSRLLGFPPAWKNRIRSGDERTAQLWYSHSFVRRLSDALPLQEIGLHGGLTHLIWTDAFATPEIVKRELGEGIRALEEVQLRPSSFSFGWDREAYHNFLVAQGIRVYRGRTPVFAYRLGRTLPGALLRAVDEAMIAAPPVVWPVETLPGLWNIPSSLFLYPMAGWRTRVIGLHSRIQRFQRGLDAAVRLKGVFHFCMHPENLIESTSGFSVLEDILDRLTRAQDKGDVEVLTMSEVVARIERQYERSPCQPQSPPSDRYVECHAREAGRVKQMCPDN